MALKNRKKNGEKVNPAISKDSEIEAYKPSVPIFEMTSKSMEAYFSTFKDLLAMKQGIKLKRKWPGKSKEGEILLPTPLQQYDEVCEKILPRDKYSPGKKFAEGKINLRLKLLLAYLMLKNHIDPDSWAETIPPNYKKQNFTFEEIQEKKIT